jgi:hypothetical protein
MPKDSCHRQKLKNILSGSLCASVEGGDFMVGMLYIYFMYMYIFFAGYSVLATPLLRGRGRGEGRGAKSYDGEKAWPNKKSINILW